MAQEEEYQIPIFLINGQLDSGKTRFIQDTIAMGQFAEASGIVDVCTAAFLIYAVVRILIMCAKQ